MFILASLEAHKTNLLWFFQADITEQQPIVAYKAASEITKSKPEAG